MKNVRVEKNVLITGAASGIGLAAAKKFASEGYKVCALDLKEVEEIDRVTRVAADITNESALDEVVHNLAMSGIEFDVIICAAGVHTMAALVETDFSKMRRIVDINLIGTMLTVRMFHRLLKKKGRVIIVTSEVATYTPMPFNGLYNISKSALDCYADALRQELNLLGQKVIAVRPGAVMTPLAVSSAASTEKLAENTQIYKNESKHFVSLVGKFTGTPIDPSKIACVLYRAACSKHPRLAYSKNRNPGLVLLNLLPKRVQCAIIKMLLKRK